MRLLIAVPLLLLLIPCVFAEAPLSELYEYDQLTLQVNIKNHISVQQTGASPTVEKLTAELAWYPRESYREHIVSVTTVPQAEEIGDAYLFAWERPGRYSFDLSLQANVETNNHALPVTKKYQFPIESIPPSVGRYTEHGEIINTNDEIDAKALELARGKDDLFEVVYIIADWVTQNIEYNLSTLALGATEQSTWVFEHRNGVCDEMTSLFISMLRSLGIPARFVSGMSYTNLPEFANPWGGHGWAEVWFPDVGWVPFDVTYGTYGFVDATHLKLDDSFDAKGSSIDFLLVGRDAALLTKNLDIDMNVISKQKESQQLFTITLEPFDDVALDSYNLVTATITNNVDYYVSTRLTLGETQGLAIVSPADRNILLRPRETKKVRYLVRTNDLKDGFYYEFPLALYSGFRKVATASFTARETYSAYDKAFFDSYLESENLETVSEIIVSCAADPELAYINTSVRLTCTAKNLRNRSLRAEGCIGTECQPFPLPANSASSFDAIVLCDTAGVKALLAKVEDANAVARYSCIDHAAVEIDNLVYPEALGYGEAGSIDFQVKRTSDTLPTALTVRVVHDNFQQQWNAASLDVPQRFTLDLTGGSLDLGVNEVKVVVEFADALGGKYSEEKSFSIVPADFSLWDKMNVHLQNAQRWLEGFFS